MKLFALTHFYEYQLYRHLLHIYLYMSVKLLWTWNSHIVEGEIALVLPVIFQLLINISSLVCCVFIMIYYTHFGQLVQKMCLYNKTLFII